MDANFNESLLPGGTVEPASRSKTTEPRARRPPVAGAERFELYDPFAEVTYRAENDVAVSGETAQQVAKLLRWLEDMDDVQNVYSNADLGADAYAA